MVGRIVELKWVAVMMKESKPLTSVIDDGFADNEGVIVIAAIIGLMC